MSAALEQYSNLPLTDRYRLLDQVFEILDKADEWGSDELGAIGNAFEGYGIMFTADPDVFEL